MARVEFASKYNYFTSMEELPAEERQLLINIARNTLLETASKYAKHS